MQDFIFTKAIVVAKNNQHIKKVLSLSTLLSAIVAFVRRMDFPYLVVLVTGSSLWNTLAVTVTYKYKDVIQTMFVKKWYMLKMH